MGKSIKRSIGIRVAAAIFSILLFSVVMTVNILNIQDSLESSTQANALLDRAQKAEVAHYKWSANLSNALHAGTEFTGSLDYTGCVLGQWLYGESDMSDAAVERLRSQIEPLHRQLHESASLVLEQYASDPTGAQGYYQETIQGNLTTLVGLLDQVVERATSLNEEATSAMQHTISTMHILSSVLLALALICMISLVVYVMSYIVKPILRITDAAKPLQEGRLTFELDYHSKNELGTLAQTLEGSVQRISSYVADIDHIMNELSQGNFDVSTSSDYIGDFRTIEEALLRFTDALSAAIGNICQAERRVSGNAEQLSSGAQALAQGATQQASAVEQLYASVDSLSKGSEQNVAAADTAQESARQTREQVTVSSEQMEQMVAAMHDITEASQQIGKIIATIENIAFQTNILALNAAVEAARAGAAGKGFAVVADEVRNLATRSDEAAKATKGLIENSIQAAERGNRIVGDVSESLRRTLELVIQSTSAISAISQAIQAESESLAQVSEGIGQISSVVQTNSASSQESAAVSTELFEQVHLLEAETKKFRLKNGASDYSVMG
ncbi:MAG: HAMP domain-containing protein [Oscillospiraceae bacterium]|nr:HAMP domain-containing protein [Oscillospiraceae bacterium]